MFLKRSSISKHKLSKSYNCLYSNFLNSHDKPQRYSDRNKCSDSGHPISDCSPNLNLLVKTHFPILKQKGFTHLPQGRRIVPSYELG